MSHILSHQLPHVLLEIIEKIALTTLITIRTTHVIYCRKNLNKQI